MDCMFFWVKFGSAFAFLWFRINQPDGAIFQYKYPNRVYFDCKTRLCLILSGRQGKYTFTQESFCLQGILNDINEQDTSFLDCKHKHMMKSHLTNSESFLAVSNRIDFYGLSLFSSWSYLIFFWRRYGSL